MPALLMCKSCLASTPAYPQGHDGFRLNSGPTLALTGFGGWLGKQFLGNGKAVNMFQTREGIEHCFPMTMVRMPLRVDGQDTLVLQYSGDAWAPWCWVTDEVRRTDDGSILGLTFVDSPLIRHFVFPFVLMPRQS